MVFVKPAILLEYAGMAEESAVWFVCMNSGCFHGGGGGENLKEATLHYYTDEIL